jgi:hypothetical protein
MSATYTDAHLESAIDLYELRQNWLNESDIYASAFESVEERLNASIYHCSRVLTLADIELTAAQAEQNKLPSKAPECFVFLASRMNSSKPQISNTGYELAYQWLAQEAGKAEAAEAVLSLYPVVDQPRLLKLYDEQTSLRPALFRIFRKQMLTLPLALVSSAATAENSSDELRSEALRYAAAQSDIGLDIFRTHYVPLLSGKTQFNVTIVEAALWGGMVRGDVDASNAISAALSHAGSAADHAKLMQLAALSGNADFLPLLLMAAENNPDSGYPLLVLFGKKSVMPELLKALEVAHTMEQAAAAFNQLSDQILPRVPRLTVVGEEADDAEEAPAQIPDIKVARAWWDKHQAAWKAEERWLYGKPTNPTLLTKLCKKHAGSFGRDVLALLALANKAPLNIHAETWSLRKKQLQDTQAAVKPVAAKAVVKKVSARHA